MIALHEVFNIEPRVTDPSKGITVILDCDGARSALFVDALLGEHQVVIKSLESNYRRVPGVAGATIMGDGRVALILDAGALGAIGQHQPLAEAA
jgi:two-component system chemotaxis sensor kinase CheA